MKHTSQSQTKATKGRLRHFGWKYHMDAQHIHWEMHWVSFPICFSATSSQYFLKQQERRQWCFAAANLQVLWSRKYSINPTWRYHTKTGRKVHLSIKHSLFSYEWLTCSIIVSLFRIRNIVRSGELVLMDLFPLPLPAISGENGQKKPTTTLILQKLWNHWT